MTARVSVVYPCVHESRKPDGITSSENLESFGLLQPSAFQRIMTIMITTRGGHEWVIVDEVSDGAVSAEHASEVGDRGFRTSEHLSHGWAGVSGLWSVPQFGQSDDDGYKDPIFLARKTTTSPASPAS